MIDHGVGGEDRRRGERVSERLGWRWRGGQGVEESGGCVEWVGADKVELWRINLS